MNHIIAIFIAVIIDAMIGDPKSWPHPVKGIGYLVNKLEIKLNKGKHKRLKGFFVLIIVISITLLLSMAILFLAYELHILLGIIIEGFLIATTIARKSLKEAALEVYEPLLKNDIKDARAALSEIVGRDTEHLSEGEIVRGTIETVAENTSDGITAPLFWALLGGAPLALVYRAVNTCDSMLGYKNERFLQFGWASARFDDVINYVPARLTAFVMLLFHQRNEVKFNSTWPLIRQDAENHASPNSGWLEATVCYLMQIELGGYNYYEGVRKKSVKLGRLQGKTYPLEKRYIKETLRMMDRTTIFYVLILLMGGTLIVFTFTWF